MASNSGSIPLKLYLNRESRLLGTIERRAVARARHSFAVSGEEAAFFRGLGGESVRVIPNGVDCARYESLPTGRSTPDPVILYVGTMSWAPNAMAAEFLARDALAKVRRRWPDASLKIVGRDPTPGVRALEQIPGVEVTGAVPDILPFLGTASLLAVPLDVGGGTRLKILEAFAAGLPVVSTSIGCEGLRVADGEHLLIAGRGDFAGRIESLLDDPGLSTRIADRARRFAREHYDWEIIGDSVRDALASAIPGTIHGGTPRDPSR